MKYDIQNWISQTIKISDLELDTNEIYLNLGYGGTVPDAHFIELVQQMLTEISKFCRPKVGFFITEGLMPDNKFLLLNNQPIKVGQTISNYLHNCSHFAVFVVTAGIEFDNYCKQLKADGDIVTEFIAYSIGTEIAEAAVRFVSSQIAEKATAINMGYTHSYSPGYCSWHVSEQENLFKTMPERPCDITLNESNLMYPEKSISGIIGLGANVQLTAHSCEICSMVTCYKRKTSH